MLGILINNNLCKYAAYYLTWQYLICSSMKRSVRKN